MELGSHESGTQTLTQTQTKKKNFACFPVHKQKWKTKEKVVPSFWGKGPRHQKWPSLRPHRWRGRPLLLLYDSDVASKLVFLLRFVQNGMDGRVNPALPHGRLGGHFCIRVSNIAGKEKLKLHPIALIKKTFTLDVSAVSI